MLTSIKPERRADINVNENKAPSSSVDDEGRSYLYAAVAVLVWSTVATAFKVTLRHMDVPLMLFISTVVSTAALGTIVVLRGRAKVLLAFSRKELLLCALFGLLNPLLYYAVLFSSYDRLPAVEAQALNYTWPILLTLLMVLLFKQRSSALSVAGIMTSFLGVLVISTRGHVPFMDSWDGPSLLGIILALGSAFIWSIYWGANMRSGRRGPEQLFVSFLFGSIYVSVAALLYRPTLPSLEGIGAAVYVGLFEMGITFVVWYEAIRLSRETSKVANLIYLTPFLSLVLIWALLGEVIRMASVIGLLFIVGGIVLQGYDRARQIKRARRKVP